MTRKQEIPELSDKVLYVGRKHGLGDTLTAIALRINFAPRTLNEAVTGERTKGKKGLTKEFRDELALRLGIEPGWVEFFDPDRKDRDNLQAFIEKYDRDGKRPPCLDVREPVAALKSSSLAPPPTDLISTRTSPAWALDAQLCGVTLLGGQYGAADLDFELTGDPTILTITDESGKKIIFRREIVVSRCTLELDLGGAEIHGGLSAMKRAVQEFCNSPAGSHLLVIVTGSATAPRLVIQAREGSIGFLRPLVKSGMSIDDEPTPLCWLNGVLPDSEVKVRVRLFGSEFQDDDVTTTSLSAIDDDDEVEPPIQKAKGSKLPVDDRIKLLRRLWERAKARQQNDATSEPGSITIAFDMRKYLARGA